MSFDLAVFDIAAAPRTHDALVEWFQRQMQIEVLGSDDVLIATGPAPLRAWFTEIAKNFPPMNGFFADDGNIDNPRTADYSITPTYIYACFGWSQQVPATEAAAELAAKHGVGLYLISDKGDPIWLPDGKGDLKQMARG